MDILDTRHKTVLDNLFDGVYAIDRNHRIVYWNPAAERITGYSAAEVTGRQCADNILNHLDNNGNCLCDGFCPLAHVMADGQLRDSQIFLHHRAGHRMPVRIRAVPLRNDAGAIVGSIEIFRETRSQEALQDRLADLEKLALLERYNAIKELPVLHSQDCQVAFMIDRDNLGRVQRIIVLLSNRHKGIVGDIVGIGQNASFGDDNAGANALRLDTVLPGDEEVGVGKDAFDFHDGIHRVARRLVLSPQNTFHGQQSNDTKNEDGCARRGFHLKKFIPSFPS
jgi:PAS domain S-box-containing protein